MPRKYADPIADSLSAQVINAQLIESRGFAARVEVARYVREHADGDIEVRRLLNDILGLDPVPERSCPVPQEEA